MPVPLYLLNLLALTLRQHNRVDWTAPEYTLREKLVYRAQQNAWATR